MGIDYVVDRDCEAKQALGTETIVDLLKARSRAEYVLSMFRQKGDQRPPDQLTFMVAMNRNGQVTQTPVSVQALLDQARPLDAHARGCASCPANRGLDRGFGCHFSIGYPIEPDTEHMLLAMLP